MNKIEKIKNLAKKYNFKEASKNDIIHYDEELYSEDIKLAFIRNNEEHIFLYKNHDGLIINFGTDGYSGIDPIEEWIKDKNWKDIF